MSVSPEEHKKKPLLSRNLSHLIATVTYEYIRCLPSTFTKEALEMGSRRYPFRLMWIVM
jgi:hypothetical protein